MILPVTPDLSLGWFKDSFNTDADPFVNSILNINVPPDPPELRPVRLIEDQMSPILGDETYWTESYHIFEAANGYLTVLGPHNHQHDMGIVPNNPNEDTNVAVSRVIQYEGTTTIFETELYCPVLSFPPYQGVDAYNYLDCFSGYLGLSGGGFSAYYRFMMEYLQIHGVLDEGAQSWVLERMGGDIVATRLIHMISIMGYPNISQSTLNEIYEGVPQQYLQGLSAGDDCVQLWHRAETTTNHVSGEDVEAEVVVGASYSIYKTVIPCTLSVAMARGRSGFFAVLEGAERLASIVAYGSPYQSPIFHMADSSFISTNIMRSGSPFNYRGLSYIPARLLFMNPLELFALESEIRMNFFNQYFAKVDGGSGFRVGRVGVS